MLPMQREDHKPRSWVRALLVLGLIAIAIGVVIAVAMMRGRAEYRAHDAPLPDGTTVDLLGTAVGNANFTTETKWQAVARQVLPARFKKWLPAVISGNCRVANSNNLVVYVHMIPPVP